MATERFEHHFPGYEILAQLGRGNARVLKARNTVTGELVAIKHFAINTDADTLKRFQRESEIMKVLKHPNIVKIKEVRLEASLPYIVMELIEGGDLRSLLKQRGCLGVPDVATLGIQLSRALNLIHENGIVHRDIKPENIMFRVLPNEELHFLLTDFGIAKLREQSHTVTGTSMMTYEYASPEQFDNPKSVTAATDFYSLGVVLYECLTGHVPFPLKDLGMIPFIQKVMNEPPPQMLLSQGKFLPPTLELLIKGMLAKTSIATTVKQVRISDPGKIERLLYRAISEDADKDARIAGNNVNTLGSYAGYKPPVKTVSYNGNDVYQNAIHTNGNTNYNPVGATDGTDQHNGLNTGDEADFATGTTVKNFGRGPSAGIKALIVIGIIGAAGMIMFYAGKWKQGTDAAALQPATNTDTMGWNTSALRDTVALIAAVNRSVLHHKVLPPVKSPDTITTTIEYPDGKYVGQVAGNTKNGLGTFFWNDGDRYSGYFVNGEKEGKGTFYYKNRDLYVGDWKDGKKNGAGILYTNELTYEGGFADDYFDGFGTLNASENRIVTNCPDCRTFKGYWREDMKEGFGECFDKDGLLIYQGQFADDQPVDEYPNVDRVKK